MRKKARAYHDAISQRGYSVVCDGCIGCLDRGTVYERHISWRVTGPPNVGVSQPCNVCGDTIMLRGG